jgi:hypothetical protein
MRFLTPFILILSSCASHEGYYITQREQTAAWERVEIARAQAAAKRYDALSVAARDGSDLARVAVAFATAGLNNAQHISSPPPQVQPPPDEAYKWASLIIPTAANIASVGFGYKLGAVQSNNAARQAEASYGAIASVANGGFGTATALAGFIQAPGPVTNTTTNTTTTSTNTTSTNQTLSGTGVLGSGSYAVRNCNGGTGGNTTVGGYPGSGAGGTC